MKSSDRLFLGLLVLLLSASAPAFDASIDPVGVVVAVGGGAASLSLLSLLIRQVLMKLNVLGYRDRVMYLEAIDKAERFFGRPMSAAERARFDRAYWS